MGFGEHAARRHVSTHAPGRSGRRVLTWETAPTATERSVVYVIDDDVSVREAVEDLLQSIGLQVLVFGSTREFLDSKRPDAPGCLVSTSGCRG